MKNGEGGNWMVNKKRGRRFPCLSYLSIGKLAFSLTKNNFLESCGFVLFELANQIIEVIFDAKTYFKMLKTVLTKLLLNRFKRRDVPKEEENYKAECRISIFFSHLCLHSTSLVDYMISL